MADQIAPTKEALTEATQLAGELLADIELSRIPLSSIALKASRLARLLCRFDYEKIFRLEASGYPTTPKGLSPEIWELAVRAGRKLETKDLTSDKVNQYAYVESIAEMEGQVESAKLGLQVSQDANSSAPVPNPLERLTQSSYSWNQTGNSLERQSLRQQIINNTKRLAERRSFHYNFVSGVYHELKFSQIAQDIFSEYRQVVDLNIGRLVPDAIEKFAAIHENLRSTNPEDWSNSAHSCRRILQDLADALFSPQKECRVVGEGKEKREIKLGPEQYINRLVCYVEDQAKSDKYVEIVGSHLQYMGNRLDALFDASQKGSHSVIKKEEANRVAIYTYMIVGDILALTNESSSKERTP